MDGDSLVATYLHALRTADADLAVSLFSDDAVVHSPLYGPLHPRDFYPVLFSDTSASHLQLMGTMSGEDVAGARLVSFFFHFDWRLPSGRPAPFDVVDVARLTSDGLIDRLHIVYDTVSVRPAFEAETGRPSWRQPG
ncbi:nuclear transport factor 2 family protein [Quadrisphaera oryzae]|uniref:nuclear transport factor 2 family protein n=1 Tax=Quadrisphaera TaxID=317661 RepID=UPI001645F95A|nr:nuclear transport factor 2 family protein [Quadrisphaera sp. RL12-1S]MBC3763867.1 nuclear transport factor 2 family protein [Quadrisphaera sp. RL12-1S]